MSPYQHLFSTNSVLSVWKNLRATKDHNDLLLTFQYQPAPDLKKDLKKKNARGEKITEDEKAVEGRTVKAAGSHIGFVVPWRSLQAQKKELAEKERELAEALVALAGETLFTDLPTSLQSSASGNPYIQVRHIAAGISRQMSKIEIQMAENSPYFKGKNLYTSGEIIRKFLPPIAALLDQRPVPRRMIFELLMELKDIVLFGTQDLAKDILEDELNNHTSYEDLDDVTLVALTPVSDAPSENISGNGRTANSKGKSLQKSLPPTPWLHDADEILYHLESLETSSETMHRLGVDDFCAKSMITLRRMLDRRSLHEFGVAKKKRTERCAEYARCMKWAGLKWRQNGGCRRGCPNEDEDPEGLPSWHSSSRHFEKEGTYMIGNGEGNERAVEDSPGLPKLGA